jgi:3-dehydroquinate synthase
MDKITLHLKNRNYPIYFTDGKKNRLAEILSRHFLASQWVIVTNPIVDRLYGTSLRRELKRLGLVHTVIIPDGERSKNLQTVERIYKKFIQLKVDRKTPVLALGGGVVGDVAGFAAATFLRGVPLVQIPTTLLAQVDSSVGGKTGVDLATGKNLIGAFYQPDLVWIDVSTLTTLPRREILCGTAEVIKYGAIKSQKLFSTLESNLESFLGQDPSLLKKVVKECVQIKADVVERDEKETLGLRAILNFGHTLGHAIETLSGYQRFTHGEAIAIGMNFAADLSRSLGLADPKTVERLKSLLHQADLFQPLPRFSRNAYLKVMARDKKRVGEKIRYVLLKRIGTVVVKELKLDMIGKKLDEFLKK